MIVDITSLCHVIESSQKRTEADLPLFLHQSKVNFSKTLLFIVCELSERLPSSARKLSELSCDCDAIIFEDETLFYEFTNFFSRLHQSKDCQLCKLQSNVQEMDDSGIESDKMGTETHELDLHSVNNENRFIVQQSSSDFIDLIQCEFCGHTTKTDKQMKNHFYKNHFKQVKSFSCPNCDKSFYRKSDLTRHSLVHSSVAQYTCKTCSKKFKRTNELRKHELTHSINFQCDYCTLVFTQKTALIRHYETVHTTTASFDCNFCKKVFNRSDNLKRHVVKCSKKYPQ